MQGICFLVLTSHIFSSPYSSPSAEMFSFPVTSKPECCRFWVKDLILTLFSHSSVEIQDLLIQRMWVLLVFRFFPFRMIK